MWRPLVPRLHLVNAALELLLLPLLLLVVDAGLDFLVNPEAAPSLQDLRTRPSVVAGVQAAFGKTVALPEMMCPFIHSGKDNLSDASIREGRVFDSAVKKVSDR